jgi:HAE1 family hydrophobic/amphiphilic exporter-1
VRLRPILMTTLTTVLGLLPMALSVGEGAELRAPLAITVSFGLLLSTVLTLVVIPAVYMVVPSRIRAEGEEPVDEHRGIPSPAVKEAAS